MKKVVIIGQGYVGLPLAQGAVRAGLNVTGLDLNKTVVNGLNAGRSHVDDLSDTEITEMLESGYVATDDLAVIADADTVVICVPTPLNDVKGPNLGAVRSAALSISEYMKPGALVVLESTTYPGTTEELLLPVLEAGGREIDKDFFLAFSPERIDPGNKTFGLKNTPKVVGGVTPASTEQAALFYDSFVDEVVKTKGAKEAEMAKLLENTYRHVNIALVNEMAQFSHELGIDLWNVIDAAKTKPFGFQAFYPGPGVGGHCIPIDPNYLDYQVQKVLGRPFRFVQLAEEINSSMPHYVVSRAQAMLNSEQKPLNGSRILLLGVTYKANIADSRETPALPLAELLQQQGAIVSYHDPKVAQWETSGGILESIEDLNKSVPEVDLVVFLQGHTEYDANQLATLSKLFLDTRGISTSSSAHKL